MPSDFVRLEMDRDSVQVLIDKLNQMERKQIPFAMQLAMNKSTIECRDYIKEKMKKVFDKPTPFTLNSLYMKKATKQKLESRLFFKDRFEAPKGNPAGEYLKPDVYGAERPAKRSEELLRKHGILKQGEYLIPSNAAPIDRFGNVQRSEIVKILSALQSTFDPTAYSRTKGKTGRSSNTYFVTESSTKRTVKKRTGESIAIRRTRAIWRRTVYGALPMFFIINRAPKYNSIFKFEQLAMTKFNLVIDKQFREALDYAMSTAKDADTL